ncbi:unnamed protein product [Amoebophrya sp. A120]|nr:unnamed protein product [Amoebophrya sp. A120]|eukprot:GSA120T00024167001.1
MMSDLLSQSDVSPIMSDFRRCRRDKIKIPKRPTSVQLLAEHATPNFVVRTATDRMLREASFAFVVLRNPAFPYPKRVASTEELLSVIMENTKQTHPYGCVLSAVEGDQVLCFQESWKKLYGFTVQEDPTGQSIKDVCYCGAQQANGPRWDNGLSELLANPAGDDWDGVPVFIKETGETIYVRRALSCVVGEQGLPGERPVNIKKQWHLQALGDDGSTLLFRNQRVLPRRHRNFAEGAQLAITISVLTARDPFGRQPLTFLLEPHPWTIAITSPQNYYDEEVLYPESLVCNADWHNAVMLDTRDQLDEQDLLMFLHTLQPHTNLDEDVPTAPPPPSPISSSSSAEVHLQGSRSNQFRSFPTTPSSHDQLLCSSSTSRTSTRNSSAKNITRGGGKNDNPFRRIREKLRKIRQHFANDGDGTMFGVCLAFHLQFTRG